MYAPTRYGWSLKEVWLAYCKPSAVVTTYIIHPPMQQCTAGMHVSVNSKHDVCSCLFQASACISPSDHTRDQHAHSPSLAIPKRLL